MNNATKEKVTELLKSACDRAGSQNKFATSHRISGATVSNILKRKWALVSDSMWQRVAAASNYRGLDWQPAETRDLRLIGDVARMCQEDGLSMAVSHEPGAGKSYGLQYYAANNANVFYMQCDDHMSKKLFMVKLYRALGKDPSGLTTGELAEEIADELMVMEHPLLILDEVDKMRDSLLMYFITLYNRLNGICGILLVGAPFMRSRWELNAKRNRRGFAEIYSRIGRRFMPLNGANKRDVAMICSANGVKEEADILEVWNEVEHNRDLRRVKRAVEAIQKRNAKLKAA